MSDKTLVKVVLQWSDGSAQQLSGDAAQAWLEKVNGPMMLQQLRSGVQIAPDPWESYSPRERLPLTRFGRTGKFSFRGPFIDQAALRSRFEDLLNIAGVGEVGREAVLPLLLDLVHELYQSDDVRGYVYANTYPDGRLGEVFIVLDRAGSSLRGFADAVAASMSVRLQRGETCMEVTDKLVGMKFDPAGPTGNALVPRATSVLDFAARWLRHWFGPKAGGVVDSSSETP